MKPVPRGSLDLLSFACLTCALSWMAVAALALLGPHDRTVGTRLLMGTMAYAFTMGWQPIVAWWVVRRIVGPSSADRFPLRTPPPHLFVVATVGPLALAATACGVAALASVLGVVPIATYRALLEPELSRLAPSAARGALLALAYVVTVTLVAVQAFAEEVGWRGYFFARLGEEIGPRRALWAHGVVWGFWYAPVLWLSSDELDLSALRIASFIVTCALMGVIFGWMRLISRSLVPAMIANAVLTLVAGLPFVLRGVDVGVRDAIYTPAGWLPMLLVIVWLSRKATWSVVAAGAVDTSRPINMRSTGRELPS